MALTRSQHKAHAEAGLVRLDEVGNRLSELMDATATGDRAMYREDVNTAIASMSMLAQRTELHIAAAAIKDWDNL